MKKSIPIKPFWYSDVLVFPKAVTVITTKNREGVLNAAPYSYFMTFDIMDRSPKIIVGMRKFAHTYKNIVETGEFVVNFPSADFIEDVMETCRFYPEGINELDYTRFTTAESKEVSVPSISECGQHLECRLHKSYEIDSAQAHVIGEVAAIVVDEELEKIDRDERIKRLNLPVSLGSENRRIFHFGKISSTEKSEVKPSPEENIPDTDNTGKHVIMQRDSMYLKTGAGKEELKIKIVNI